MRPQWGASVVFRAFRAEMFLNLDVSPAVPAPTSAADVKAMEEGTELSKEYLIAAGAITGLLSNGTIGGGGGLNGPHEHGRNREKLMKARGAEQKKDEAEIARIKKDMASNTITKPVGSERIRKIVAAGLAKEAALKGEIEVLDELKRINDEVAAGKLTKEEGEMKKNKILAEAAVKKVVFDWATKVGKRLAEIDKKVAEKLIPAAEVAEKIQKVLADEKKKALDAGKAKLDEIKEKIQKAADAGKRTKEAAEEKITKATDRWNKKKAFLLETIKTGQEMEKTNKDLLANKITKAAAEVKEKALWRAEKICSFQ